MHRWSMPNEDVVLHTFQQRVIFLPADEAARVRARFIERFVDTDREYWQKNITNVQHDEEGPYYNGYLWDVLRHRDQVTIEQVYNAVAADQIVTAFWDLHHRRRVSTENYFRFPRGSALRGTYGDLLLGASLLPEDLYISSDDLPHAVILTHETDKADAPFYLLAHDEG